MDVANQVITRNSLTLQSISAILDMPKEVWPKTDLSGNKDRQVGESEKRRQANLFPTPVVSDNRGAAKGEIEKGNPKHRLKVEVELLPTTRVSMANGPTRKEIARGNPKSRIEVEVMLGENNWGRFEPAIRRWEDTIGRPAPAPTKPDGKEGAHRLSSLFTEWLMGLPEGWITGLGLKRNDELKLAGNGVVPAQAEMALRILLEDDNLLERIKK